VLAHESRQPRSWLIFHVRQYTSHPSDTPMVVIIVLLLGIPVFLTGVISRKKSYLVCAAIVMGLIGIATGHPIYAAADLFGVAVGYYLGSHFVRREPKK
jgi:hypothetical protein